MDAGQLTVAGQLTGAGQSADADWQCDKSLLDCLDYLFRTGTASDVAFVVNGGKGQILAHKTVLVSRSSVFCAMLDDPTISKWEITLLDTQQPIFSLFLRYLYTDMIELTVDVATSLLPMARQYCVNRLVKKCETFLKENFASQNAVMFLQNSSLPSVDAQEDDMDDDDNDEEDVTLESEDDKPPEFHSSDQKIGECMKKKYGMTDVDHDNLTSDADEAGYKHLVDTDGSDDKHLVEADSGGDKHLVDADSGGDKHLVDADSGGDKHLVDADEDDSNRLVDYNSDKHLTDEEDDECLSDADVHHDIKQTETSLSNEKSRTPAVGAPDESSAMDLTMEASTSKVVPDKLYVTKQFLAPAHSGADEEMVDVGGRRTETSRPEGPSYTVTSMVRGLVTKHLEIQSRWQPHRCRTCGRMFFDLNTLTDHENTHKSDCEHHTVTGSSDTGDYKRISMSVSGHKFSEVIPSSGGDASFRIPNQASVFDSKMYTASNLPLISTDGITGRPESLSEGGTLVSSLWPVSTELNLASSAAGTSQQNQHLRISLVETPFACQICGRRFQLEQQLEKHSKKHLLKKTFKCNICSTKFNNKANLDRHLQQHTKDIHQRMANVGCKHCGKNFRFESTYKEHVMKEHEGINPFQCELCEKDFKSRLGLKLHMMGHTGERPHVCNVCGKGFRQKVSLMTHSKKHTENVHVCTVCGDQFRTPVLLRNHLLTHSQTVQMFPCVRCGKQFKDERFYMKHLETHGVSMTLVCEHCELEFEDEALYGVHCITEHDGMEFDEPGSLGCGQCASNFKSVKAFNNHQRMHMKLNENREMCETCGLVFASLQLLQQHGRIHDKDKMFQCEICGKQYKSKCALVRHVMFHTGDWKYNCEICGRGLSTNAELKKHMLAHSSEKAHMCDVCGNQYKNQVTLDRHLMSHRGDRPHVCEICGKGYTDKYQLKMHLRAHAKEKPFKCDICRKGFDDADMLLTHTLEHMGKKLYKCDICAKFYSRDSALKVHLRIHTGEKPHKCEMCGKDFTNLGDKQRHVKIHTGEKPFICNICGKGFSDRKYLRKHTLSSAHKPELIHI